MEKGFTPDGYILDQDCFEHLLYRGCTSNINGCGWIAAYNFLHALGYDVEHRTVHRDMDAFFPAKIPGPTPVRILRRYLRRWGRYPLSLGKTRSLAAASRSLTGILRYWEDKTPHFVAFVRTDGDTFRFFNVCDGGEELTLSMTEFFRTHCGRGFVRVITAK